MLEVQFDNHLGYDRYDDKNKNTKNSRNGYRNKNVKLDFVGKQDNKYITTLRSQRSNWNEIATYFNVLLK